MIQQQYAVLISFLDYILTVNILAFNSVFFILFCVILYASTAGHFAAATPKFALHVTI